MPPWTETFATLPSGMWSAPAPVLTTGTFGAMPKSASPPFAPTVSVAAVADVDRQAVVEEAGLLPGGEVREEAHVVVEVATRELAEGDGSLLAVDDLEGAVAAPRPIHDVEGE